MVQSRVADVFGCVGLVYTMYLWNS